MKTIIVIFFGIISSVISQQSYEGKLIFPLQEKHVHSSSIVELPNAQPMM